MASYTRRELDCPIFFPGQRRVIQLVFYVYFKFERNFCHHLRLTHKPFTKDGLPPHKKKLYLHHWHYDQKRKMIIELNSEKSEHTFVYSIKKFFKLYRTWKWMIVIKWLRTKLWVNKCINNFKSILENFFWKFV